MKFTFPILMILISSQVSAQIRSSEYRVIKPNGSFETEFQIKTIAQSTEFDQLTISVYENQYVSWMLWQSSQLQSQLDSALHTKPVEIFLELDPEDIQAFESQLYLFFKDKNKLKRFREYFKNYCRLQIRLLDDPSYLVTPFPRT